MKKENENKKNTNIVGFIYKHLFSIVMLVFVLPIAVFYVVKLSSLSATEIADYFSSQEPYIIIGFLVAMIIVSIASAFHEKSFDYDAYIQKLSDKIGDKSSPENTNSTIPKDALERMLINLADIKEYYTWSQKQAKAAFALAVVMCICSFGLMAVTVFFAMKFQIAASATIVSGIGTAVTGLIAGTALLVYNNSIKQLNYYYTALHEDERFLSSINLISWFSTPEKKDAMLQEIIESELKLNTACLSDTPHQASKRSETMKTQSKKQED